MRRLTPRLASMAAGLIILAGMARADDQPPKYNASTLDELAAPVALYPDPILSQVMTAATFPDQVRSANKWAQDHKDLKGQDLADAMTAANFDWDASVQALVPFPTVLETMTRDSNWCQKFGNAVLAQRGDVMDSVQRLRKKAQDAGNLKSSEQITVSSSEPNVIEIQPADPQVIYVPTYDPVVIYQPAPPPSSGGNAAAAAIFGFVAGVAVAECFDDDWYGGCGFYWSSHTVVVHNCAWGRTWSNRYAYHPPYPARPVYVNRNVNVNVNRNTNINGDVNIGNRTNVNVDNSRGNAARADAGRMDDGRANTAGNLGGKTQSPAVAKAPNQDARTAAGSADRGYKRSTDTSSSNALSGSRNGRSESKASSRGKASSGAAHAGANAGAHAGGAHRGGQ
jgi:hypothetical protein